MYDGAWRWETVQNDVEAIVREHPPQHPLAVFDVIVGGQHVRVPNQVDVQGRHHELLRVFGLHRS